MRFLSPAVHVQLCSALGARLGNKLAEQILRRFPTGRSALSVVTCVDTCAACLQPYVQLSTHKLCDGVTELRCYNRCCHKQLTQMYLLPYSTHKRKYKLKYGVKSVKTAVFQFSKNTATVKFIACVCCTLCASRADTDSCRGNASTRG